MLILVNKIVNVRIQLAKGANFKIVHKSPYILRFMRNLIKNETNIIKVRTILGNIFKKFILML